MTIRSKLYLLIISLFVAAISNIIFVFQLERYGEEKLEWVIHTHEVLDNSLALLAGLTDAETGQRGFLLTENPNYLEPYHRGLEVVKDRLDVLYVLTSDNPEQTARLQSVESNIQLKFEELAETVDLVQSGDSSGALAVVVQDRGKLYMDQIREDIGEFITTERVLLEIRNGDFRANRSQLTTIITIEFLFFIALAILTVDFLRQSLFKPLRLLLAAARKVEEGQKMEIADVVESNEMGRLLSTFFQMSERIFSRVEKLDHKAHHDELTGLKNRTSLPVDLDNSIARLKDTGSKLAVLFMDLDGLKKINDSFGHDFGDLVLKKTADRLNRYTRHSDSIYRVGGDEYVALIKDVESISEIDNIVENILSSFEKSAVINDQTIDISVSIGVAISPDDSTSSTDLVKFADVAMYKAKSDKKARYLMFNDAMLVGHKDSK